MTTEEHSYGTWAVGDVSDKEIIARLRGGLELYSQETHCEWHIHDLKIMRRAPVEISPDDYSKLAQRGYTSIKATISKDKYR